MPLLLGVWAVLVLVGYTAAPAHRVPLDLAWGWAVPSHGEWSAGRFAATWLARLRAAGACGLLDLAVLAAGASSASWLRARGGRLHGWLLGLAPAALALLGLGLCGLWLPPLLGGLALGGAAVMLRRLTLPRPSGLALFALAPCLLSLPGALAPETAVDALRYHLGLPWLYLEAHKVFHVPRFLFSGFPGTMEMLYGSVLALHGPAAAKLFAWQFLPVAGLLVFRAARTDRRLAALLAACFCGMPFLGSLAIFANVDLPLLTVEAAAFALLAEWIATARGKPPVAAAWLLGTALGMKYLGAFALLGAGAALLLAAPRRAAIFARRAWPYALFLPAAWGVKSWLLTGNPSFPYLAGLFGAHDVEPATLERHLRYAVEWRAAHPAWRAWADLLPVSLLSGTYSGWREALSP
ncbi:MAG: hypothetical protein AAB368_06695, partial [bacterium]